MDQAVRSGLEFLRAVQDPSGRLPAVASGNRALTGTCVEDETPFVAAFVCPALEALDCPEAEVVRERALGYLIDRAEPPGLWRYWRSPEQVLDPDLDDTACASLALRDRHLSILCGANRGAILGNRDEQGRFKTWLRPAGRPNDVDSVVNANVVAYLGEGPETERAIAWLVDLVAADRVSGTSWYYPLESASLAYAMARAAAFGVRAFAEAGATLSERLLAGLSKRDVLETAMVVTAAAGFGAGEASPVSDAVGFLRAAQRPDGSWRPEAFYCGPEPPGPRTVYFGSAALTTALCLEALARGSGGTQAC